MWVSSNVFVLQEATMKYLKLAGFDDKVKAYINSQFELGGANFNGR